MSFLLLVALISFSKSNENDLDMVLLDMVLLDEFGNDGGSFFVPTQVAPTSKIPIPSGSPNASDLVPRSPRPTSSIDDDVISYTDDDYNATIANTTTYSLEGRRTIGSVTLGSLIVLPGAEVLAEGLTIKHGIDLRGSAKLLAKTGYSIVIETGTIAMTAAGKDVPRLDLGENPDWIRKVGEITIDVEFFASNFRQDELENESWPLIISDKVAEGNSDLLTGRVHLKDDFNVFEYGFDAFPKPGSSGRLLTDRQALYLTAKDPGDEPPGSDPDPTSDDDGLGTGEIIGIAVAVVVLVVAIVIIIICIKGKGKGDEEAEKVPSTSNSDDSSSG